MATSVITNTILDGDGTARANITVTAYIRPTGNTYRTAEATEVSPSQSTTTNASGVWNLTLERNSNITPANSYYEIVEALPDGRRSHLITVGSSNATLLASIITLPPAGAPQFITQASGDARYLQVGGTASSLTITGAPTALAVNQSGLTSNTTGPGLVKFIVGSTGSRPAGSAGQEGLISQLYAGTWTDTTGHSAVNAYMSVPTGSNFFAFANSSSVSNASAVGGMQSVAYFGHAEGTGGTQLWAADLEVWDNTTGYGVSTAGVTTTLVGIEVDMLVKAATPGITLGQDIIMKTYTGAGARQTGTGLRIRSEAPTLQTWSTALETHSPGVQWITQQDGATLPNGLWRLVTSGNAFRYDLNTDNAGLFATVNTVFDVEGDGTTYLGGHPTVGGNLPSIQIKANQGSTILGNSAVATNATDGFLYIRGNAGAPSGVPTAFTGRFPFYYDSTNHKIWVYDGGWKGIVVA